MPRLPVRQGAALWRYERDGPVAARLVCLPHAGGGAFLNRRWPSLLPPSIELVTVELPGRGTRLREPPAMDVAALVADLLPELLGQADRPIAYFGHSMGALLAFELALSAERVGRPPLALFLAGCAAPSRIVRRPPIRDLPDSAFLDRLDRLGALPSEVIADPDLRAMALRVLRGDITLLETYRHPGEAVVNCPIWVMGGDTDDAAAADDLHAWRDHAGDDFSQEIFPGGHFFVRTDEDRIVGYIGERLAKLAATIEQAR